MVGVRLRHSNRPCLWHGAVGETANCGSANIVRKVHCTGNESILSALSVNWAWIGTHKNTFKEGKEGL